MDTVFLPWYFHSSRYTRFFCNDNRHFLLNSTQSTELRFSTNPWLTDERTKGSTHICEERWEEIDSFGEALENPRDVLGDDGGLEVMKEILAQSLHLVAAVRRRSGLDRVAPIAVFGADERRPGIHSTAWITHNSTEEREKEKENDYGFYFYHSKTFLMKLCIAISTSFIVRRFLNFSSILCYMEVQWRLANIRQYKCNLWLFITN